MRGICPNLKRQMIHIYHIIYNYELSLKNFTILLVLNAYKALDKHVEQ